MRLIEMQMISFLRFDRYLFAKHDLIKYVYFFQMLLCFHVMSCHCKKFNPTSIYLIATVCVPDIVRQTKPLYICSLLLSGRR